jgi:hypothetical protein
MHTFASGPPSQSFDPLAGFAREVAECMGTPVGRVDVKQGWGALAETRGVRHVFATAPTVGAEHHVLVPSALRSTVLLGWQGDRPTWQSADPALAQWLSGHPVLARLGERLSWMDTIAPGAPALRFEWILQLRPTGGAGGHLVVRAGDYGGRTGLAEVLAVVDVLGGALPLEVHAQGVFLVPATFVGSAGPALGLAPSGAGPSSHAPPPMQTFVPPSGADRDAEYSRRLDEANRCFMSRRFDEFIAIWEGIDRDLADIAGPGGAQLSIGSGWYAKGDFARAIHHYEIARQQGHEPGEVEDNIASAREKMR